MKKLLLLAGFMVSLACFAADGPDFPFDMNEIVRAAGYNPSETHPIQDKNRERTRDCFGPSWYVHGTTPYYGPYVGGPHHNLYWYPDAQGYGPAPAAAIGGAIAGAVIGTAAATCCC